MYRFNFRGVDIIVISDTHGKHRELNIDSCELLIHLGEICDSGNKTEISDL